MIYPDFFCPLCLWLYFLLKWLGANIILQTKKSYLFKWSAYNNILMPNLVQSPVYVGSMRLILFKLWHNSVSMGTWMLTKPSETPCSFYLIPQDLPSFSPTVLTKYNHIGLVEMKQIPLCAGVFIFFNCCSFLFGFVCESYLFYSP